MNEIKIESIENWFTNKVTTSVVSPYKISKLLSEYLGYTVQGPMIYNYRNQKFGYVASKNELDKWVVEANEAIRFMVKFSAKRVSAK